MSCDVAKPCHLPALNSGEKRFLSAHETFSLAPLIVVHFVLAVGDAEEFSQSLVLQCLSPFFSRLSQECPSFPPVEEDRDDQQFVKLELGLETDIALSSLVISVVAIRVRISALQVPHFDTVSPKYLKLDTSSIGSLW